MCLPAATPEGAPLPAVRRRRARPELLAVEEEADAAHARVDVADVSGDRDRARARRAPVGGRGDAHVRLVGVDHLVGGADDDVGLALEPVEERSEGDGADRVRVAAVADVVHEDRHPAATVLLGLRHVALDLRQRGVGLDRVVGAVGERRRQRQRVGVRAALAGGTRDQAGGQARALVAAAPDDRLGVRVLLAERIGEVVGGQPVREQCRAVVADLVALVGLAERGQVRMRERVAGDLVAGGLGGLQLRVGQAAALAEPAVLT